MTTARMEILQLFRFDALGLWPGFPGEEMEWAAAMVGAAMINNALAIARYHGCRARKVKSDWISNFGAFSQITSSDSSTDQKRLPFRY